MAVLSRVGLDDIETSFATDQPQFGEPPVLEARALGATCGGIRMWSLYIPNGRELDHPHYDYKLAWLESLRNAGADWLADDAKAQIALAGDWNVAPEDDDVWDMEFFANTTHVSEPERAAFRSVVEAGYADVVRPHTPGPGVYTYLGLQAAELPEEARHADRLRPCLPGAGEPASPAPSSIARNARARAPATMRPSSWIWPT